jgi:hypothetical protein
VAEKEVVQVTSERVKVDPLEVLRTIEKTGAAMNVLDTYPIQEGTPAATNKNGVTLVNDDGTEVDPGTPHLTLGDLVREALRG